MLMPDRPLSLTKRLDVPADPTELLKRLPAQKGRFLLESGGGPADICQYSFLGYRPFLTFSSKGTQYQVSDGSSQKTGNGDPLLVLDELLTRYSRPLEEGLSPLPGGAVGYFGYDLGRLIETVSAETEDDLDLPDICLGFYDVVVVVDHAVGQVSLVANCVHGNRDATMDRMSQLEELLQSPAPSRPPRQGRAKTNLQVTSNFTRAGYVQAVQKAIDYIYAGDIFQVNLAQRFTAALPFSSLELWSRLRRINPSPFSAFFDFGCFELVCASPERFLLVTPTSQQGGRQVESRPMKGTRRRGDTPEGDDKLRSELLDSIKDRAELNMIVDLERNDLGRVCEFGSVRVPDARRIETYPTVFHTVATVEGTLRPSVTAGQLLKATFPGGSITGAPKVRAMEIIEELEPVRRSVYTGSIGYIGFQGRADLNIVIRTFIVKDGRAYFHAGGGIVADSRPDDEYDETVTKARALMRALGTDWR